MHSADTVIRYVYVCVYVLVCVRMCCVGDVSALGTLIMCTHKRGVYPADTVMRHQVGVSLFTLSSSV